jgi:integrase
VPSDEERVGVGAANAAKPVNETSETDSDTMVGQSGPNEAGVELRRSRPSRSHLDRQPAAAKVVSPGCRAKRSLRLHALNHQHLDLKLDVVAVSRQLGHARPSITSDVYAHLFDQPRHHADIRERMAASDFGRLLEAR